MSEKEIIFENMVSELRKRFGTDSVEEIKEISKNVQLNIGMFSK